MFPSQQRSTLFPNKTPFQTNPASPADGRSGQSCRQGVGDGDGAAIGGRGAAVSSGYRADGARLSLLEIARVGLRNSQVRQLIDGRRIVCRIIGGVYLTAPRN